MSKWLYRFLFLIGCVFGQLSLPAQTDRYKGIPDAPNPPRLVNNLSKEFPDFLTASETVALEKKLLEFNDQTSNQITIVIVDDLAGYAAWEYATYIGEKWGVGTKGFDNGVVILIKPTGGKRQRDVFVAVGEGLHPKINATRNSHIVNDILIPRLGNGDYYGALDEATNVIMQMARDAFNDADAAVKRKKKTSWSSVISILVAVLFVFVFVMKGGGGGGRTFGGRGGWGGFGGFGGWGGGGGGGWGGGGGGGGFGGFGGGSFGGGGSGGKW
ncbi:MAG: TPM domain-containing protein [Bacteroidia bacterium]|jgi:uncharacterized protein|nr:TPM domain-containing protein [Bacteroidia bacterium]